MIQALLELEKKYGNLDGLGIDIEDKKPLQIQTNNAELNKSVLNITVTQPEIKKEPWRAKIAWNVVIPIITAIAGAVVGAVIIKYFGL